MKEVVRNTNRKRRPSQRRLRTEQLESRKLLAGDVGFSQNFLEPTDVNGDSEVTTLDALIVINQLNRGEGEITGFTDVNGDGSVTTVDALNVVNHINEGHTPARAKAQLGRLQNAIETGDLPDGVTLEQVNERIAMLETAIATGVRPEGTRPEGVGRPTGVRPNLVANRNENGGYSVERVQAQIERLQGDLPEGVTDERAAARVEMLETALETGERPEGTRPKGVGRPTNIGSRPEGIMGRPSPESMQAREQFFANFTAGGSMRPSLGRPF